VWLVRVADHSRALAAGHHLLDAAERERHAALLRAADRDSYAAAHIALRRLLGAYLETDPAAVLLGREDCPVCGGPHGRPVVPGADLHFSLSHSAGLALVAVAARPVGVDVEALPGAAAVDDVTGTLHPREQAELAATPPGERPAAFLRCWARKEAYLKGTGQGLAQGVDSTYTGTGPAPAPIPGWTLADVTVDTGYAAAVAVSRTDGQQ
jgi:4'-phosphopantetheinyl transferase